MSDISDLFGGDPFDPLTVDPQADFKVITPGKYPALIEKAEVKVTKKGNGHYIGLEMQIVDGPHKGRKLFDQINIDNPSAECVEIGLRTLSALGRAINTGPITNTAQLLNQIVIAHVKVKDERNFVRTYSATGQQTQPSVPIAAASTPTPAPIVAPEATPNSPDPNVPPWQR